MFTYPDGLNLIWGDDRLLQIVISNLLSNSIKYSEVGSEIIIDISQDTDRCTLQISDHGIGISEEDQKHLFEAYYRADNTGNVKGIGLGLKIVKDFVELHGGEISVSSELDKGTTFMICLPIRGVE